MTNTTLNTPSERDLKAAFNELKKEKNAVLLAHYYQDGEIQDMADFIGDSLALAQQAAKTDADIIVFSGVVFMGETAKIVSPEKKVLVPDMNAGCSLADNCPADEFAAFVARHPGHTVVSYVNCSAEVKALSDILCTSTNAEKIIRSIPDNTPIIFGPDKHLGSYLAKKLGRPMVLWNGSCMVHELFDEKRIVKLQALHPEAEVIAHPECPEAILAHATHIGSTSSLLEYTKKSAAEEFIVVTESGIIHQMKKASPTKTFHPAPSDETCGCSQCPYMRLNTIEKLYLCLRDETPEIILPEDLMAKALKPLARMLELS